MERKEGYYWVRIKPGPEAVDNTELKWPEDWIVAEYDGKDFEWQGWTVPVQYFDINETRIPSPDEEISRSQMYQQLLERDRLRQALSDATALLRNGTSEQEAR